MVNRQLSPPSHLTAPMVAVRPSESSESRRSMASPRGASSGSRSFRQWINRRRCISRGTSRASHLTAPVARWTLSCVSVSVIQFSASEASASALAVRPVRSARKGCGVFASQLRMATRSKSVFSLLGSTTGLSPAVAQMEINSSFVNPNQGRSIFPFVDRIADSPSTPLPRAIRISTVSS